MLESVASFAYMQNEADFQTAAEVTVCFLAFAQTPAILTWLSCNTSLFRGTVCKNAILSCKLSSVSLVCPFQWNPPDGDRREPVWQQQLRVQPHAGRAWGPFRNLVVQEVGVARGKSHPIQPRRLDDGLISPVSSITPGWNTVCVK